MKSSPNPFLKTLEQTKRSADTRLGKLLVQEIKQAGRLGPEVLHTLEACSALTSRGGKRLRAGLVVAGYNACVNKPNTQNARIALELAVAVELLQAYFLIQDDWMDQDDTRRGGPAVHAALRGPFGTEHKGACGAMLGGDYLATLANAHAVKHAASHSNFAAIFTCFAQMQLAAIQGQLLDVIALKPAPELIYALKTGSYTVSGPLQLGALVAGASPALVKKLDAFAEPVGLAFQLRDDLLGLFASAEVTGKPYGSDIRAGKWTWTAEYAHAHANAAQLRTLKRAFGNAKATEKEVIAAAEAVEQSGARSATEAQITEKVKLAQKRLSRCELPSKGQALLEAAIVAFTKRAS
jgi:geranylgeranyl diphosphate synthase type I